jgi:flagellin
VQFQVGANEGQTLSLSIGNTSANAIGLNQSSASAKVFGAGKTTGVLTTFATASAATAGGFTAGTVSFTGNNGNTGSITAAANSSAAALATKINDLSGTTGVTAQATNSITLKATAGTTGFAFKIQGSGSAQTINAATVSALAAQINGQTGTTGVSATVSTSGGSLTLTQANGKNIVITGVTAGSLSAASQGTSATKNKLDSTAGSASGVIQGQVEFQSSAAFNITGGGAIGLSAASKLTSLSDINVTTASGANTAINVVKFALQGLNNQGGVLGAAQQRLSANINNLNTSSENVTSALGVVQDANIPEVSNQLTQAQIQAQAGVAALKSSTTLQQSYLSLLP